MSEMKMLSVPDLMQMGFSRMRAYQLFHMDGFPKVQIGKRLYVRNDRLAEWLEEHEGVEGITV